MRGLFVRWSYQHMDIIVVTSHPQFLGMLRANGAANFVVKIVQVSQSSRLITFLLIDILNPHDNR